MENVYSIYNDFGAQSSINSAATYESANGSLLTRETVYSALKRMIAEHYALRVIAVNRFDEKKREILWEAQLRELNLDRIVEFITADESQLQSILEATHNEWLDWEDHSLPLWRLKIVNGRHIIWSYNHFVADGLSGYAFQRGFLRYLNSPDDKNLDASAIITVDPLEPPRPWREGFVGAFFLLRIIWATLVMHLARFFFGSALLFSDLPVNPIAPPWSDRGKKTSRVVTRLHTLRLSSSQTEALLSSCKAHGVTFGTLLHTIAVSTAAKDLYPKAWLGVTGTPLSIRPFASPVQNQNHLVNSAACLTRLQKIRAYREAATSLQPQSAEEVSINADKIWEVTLAYRRVLQKSLTTRHVFDGMFAMDMMPSGTKEMFDRCMPTMWLYQRFSLNVSNLGTFVQSDTASGLSDEKNKIWKITDVQFSAGAVASQWGWGAPVLNVAGLKGGDTVISFTSEEGIMPEKQKDLFVANIKRRFELLIESESREKQL